MDDRSKGLYRKYDVRRLRDAAAHDGCDYFVLDLVHDEYARAAILAYAQACRADYPKLAEDLEARASRGAEP